MLHVKKSETVKPQTSVQMIRCQNQARPWGGGGSSSAAALGPRDRGALPKYVHTSILHVYSLQARPKHITRPGKLKHRAADSSFPSLSHASRLASHGTVSPLPDCRRFISADLLRVSDDSRITIDTHAVK
jgi:hypothetical protein